MIEILKDNTVVTDYEGLRELGENPKVSITLTHLTCGHYVYPVTAGHHCAKTPCPLCGEDHQMDWPSNHYHGKFFPVRQIGNHTTKATVGNLVHMRKQQEFIKIADAKFWKEEDVIRNLRIQYKFN